MHAVARAAGRFELGQHRGPIHPVHRYQRASEGDADYLQRRKQP